MLKTVLAILLAGLVSQKPMADHCTVDGSGDSVKCGGTAYMACIELHGKDEICGSEDPLPSCCAASPLSPDKTATACGCCRQAKKQVKITIPYDEVN